MFVGVGASRVRDLFSQAKKNAPCIVFIDEIDAIGGARAGGGGGGPQMGGNDEREQTLNQILTEMDGFDGNSGVIVLAATNRADTLDSALIRPGRFDRRVPVGLPDVKGRREILNVHIRGKPLAEDVDLDVIAKRTIGFSGASLANLMNEAAIVAARNKKTEISYEEIDYAIDRTTVGMAKKTGTSFPDRQRLVANHEAGHAVMGLLERDYSMVTKVTIIPRSNGAGGFTLFTPTEEQLESGMYSKRYLESQLAVALGGRCAEEIIYGVDEVTTGASNDLQQVRQIARQMVAQWGFAMDALGEAPVAWETGQEQLGSARAASADTEAKLDVEVQKLVQAAYDHTMTTLKENKALLDYMTERLIKEETIDYLELQRMRDAHLEGKDLKELIVA
jgi:cell division protease FtsH